jgi:DNA topoisomerase-1
MVVIYREGAKDKWIYRDKAGNTVKDKEILGYIASLPPIPPAYKNVRIYYTKSPDIIFDGVDDKGRLQQIYSKRYRENADKKKFKALIDFGKKMPQMLLKMQEHIESQGSGKNKLISIILRIITLCGFRIGQLKYQKLYNSIGLSTLMKKHLKFISPKLEIKFIGKKGVLNECVVEDKLIIDELKKISAGKAQADFLFTYKENDETKLINAIDVNNWLKAYNPEFTSKFFRTFQVNDLLIEGMAEVDPTTITDAQRKKRVVGLLKDISCAVNNTPGICKKSYANPELIKLYIEHPKKYKKDMINGNSSRVNFIKFLERMYT